MTAAAARPAPRYLSGVEVSKIIRAELKAAFPAVKFGVTTARGGSVNVRWTDGPTRARVEAIVNRFQGKDVDCMQDMAVNRGAFEYCGELVSTYCYVFANRELSGSFVARIVAAVAAYYGLDAPAVVENWIRPTGAQDSEVRARLCCYWSDLIYRAASDRASVSRLGRPSLSLVEG